MAQSEPRAQPLAAPSLAVRRLRLTNFRCYGEADLAVRAGAVLLHGPNGAGKTNVLEAVSLLTPGRGLRGAKLSDHIRRGPQTVEGTLWAVAATVARGGETHEIGTGLTLGPNGGEKRQVRLNGASAQGSGDLAEIVQLAWLTPAMDRLFVEGTSGRRRFLDRLTLGFDPAHARSSVRYETALRERARLLKYGPRDPAWLDALEREMAEAGRAIAMARAQAVRRLNDRLASRGTAGAFPSAQLRLEGDSDAFLAERGEDCLDAWAGRLAALRARDAESGRTGFGPHLADVVVRHTAKKIDARHCSTGEQKALLIAIVLADAWELAEGADIPAPILLLDEIAAHLDHVRRAALFEEILCLRAQAWITGTDLSLFDTLLPHAEIFGVDNGRIFPGSP